MQQHAAVSSPAALTDHAAHKLPFPLGRALREVTYKGGGTVRVAAHALAINRRLQRM